MPVRICLGVKAQQNRSERTRPAPLAAGSVSLCGGELLANEGDIAEETRWAML